MDQNHILTLIDELKKMGDPIVSVVLNNGNVVRITTKDLTDRHGCVVSKDEHGKLHYIDAGAIAMIGLP